MDWVQTKFRGKRKYVKARLAYVDDLIYVKFGFSRPVIEEIKAMDLASKNAWNPETKMWCLKNTQRNQFQLEYLQGRNPYAHYDQDLQEFETSRPLFDHQKLMVNHGLTMHHCMWAAEMGTGKTLAAIEVMEHIEGLTNQQAWYVGPKSGVKGVGLELEKWNSKVRPLMFTYEGMKKQMREWTDDRKAPRLVIFDESSKLKTPTTQQSKSALHLANSMREDWGFMNSWVILMSGTPAPKTPADWWSQCEVSCPGFLREGNIHKFKKRLAIIEEREGVAGGTFPYIVSWLDNAKKCALCGRFEEDENHQNWITDPTTTETTVNPSYHAFQPSVNEVHNLYSRMNGLVVVIFKKDCLDLPEKTYDPIKIKPAPSTLRTAKLIKSTARSVVVGLSLLRELSDGFQYEQTPTGELKTCPRCEGQKITTVKKPLVDLETFGAQPEETTYEDVDIQCDMCGGSGEVDKMIRTCAEVPTPKDDYLIEDLRNHEEVGRLIVWGGFTGTLDRIIKICHKEAWATLCVDGRGYVGRDCEGNTLPEDELLIAMDYSHPRRMELLNKYPRICFVGHPKAGGMALTLTASPTTIFYSNDFSGEARFQAEDRFHRAGMDTNRGAVIKDYIHLPTDQLVLDNLKAKKKLQDMTMNELESCFN